MWASFGVMDGKGVVKVSECRLLEATFILRRYEMATLNSAEIGWYSGARRRDFSHARTSRDGSTAKERERGENMSREVGIWLVFWAYKTPMDLQVRCGRV